MKNQSMEWKLWGEKFKKFRLKAGFASQNEFADALSHVELASGNNLVIATPQISRWEHGVRCPSKREQHLELIEGLVKLGGIQTPEEADDWLASGNQGPLTEEQRSFIFSHLN